MKKITLAFGAFLLVLMASFSFASAAEAPKEKLLINNDAAYASLSKENTLVAEIPEVANATRGTRYKFVYSYNNWKEWDVIQHLSPSNSAKWTPKKAGNYKIYVDVEGFATRVFDVEVKKDWAVGSVNIRDGLRQNRESLITAGASGNEKLEYKFVYSYNNWQEWDVIKDFSSSNTVNFTPKRLGKYDIYVDMRDVYGNIETKREGFESTLPWKYDKVLTGERIELSDSTKLSANVSGETDGLEYKFVYSYNNWKEWGVIQHLSSADSVEWTPKKAGQYDIYVDIKDKEGNFVTKKEALYVDGAWNYEKVEFLDASGAPVNDVKLNDTVKVSSVAKGATKRLEYKFVHSYENWKEWGVLKHFSKDNTYEFTPQKLGNYDIYVDISDGNGNFVTKKAAIKVVPYYFDVKLSSNKLNVGDKFNVEMLKAPEGTEYKIITEYIDSKKKYIEEKPTKEKSVELVAKHPGRMKVYVESEYGGYTVAKSTQEVNVELGWNYESVVCPDEIVFNDDRTVDIGVNITGNTEGLKYKFVYSFDNWKYWGVFRDLNTLNTAEFTPERHGNCVIYVDVIDEFGNGVTKTAPIEVKPDWEYVSVLTSARNVDEGGKAVIRPEVKGNTEGLTYKYVYSYMGWKKWGVLYEGPNSRYEFKPSLIGTYTIYVDIIDRYGYAVTKTVDITYKGGLFPIYKYDWSTMNARLQKGKICTVVDVYTGKRFKIKRLFGSKHMDAEPLTAADTATLKSVYGGKWSWDRRPIVVIDEDNLIAYAASMNGMPHGTAASDQSIYNNNFNGHFCIHFLNSRTHGSNRIDPLHKACIETAARLGSIKI